MQGEELEKVLEELDDRELAAFRKWQSSSLAPLAPDTQGKLFSLFLNGKSTAEIHRLNPQFTLGQIVHARVTGKWDQLRYDHVQALLKGIMTRVQQVTLESVHFVSDLIAAANKAHGDKIAKYLQTGDEKDLGEMQINSLRTYKEAVELLQRLTGQDKSKSEVTVTHKADDSMSTIGKVPSSEEAAEILKLLVGKKDDTE